MAARSYAAGVRFALRLEGGLRVERGTSSDLGPAFRPSHRLWKDASRLGGPSGAWRAKAAPVTRLLWRAPRSAGEVGAIERYEASSGVCASPSF